MGAFIIIISTTAIGNRASGILKYNLLLLTSIKTMSIKAKNYIQYSQSIEYFLEDFIADKTCLSQFLSGIRNKLEIQNNSFIEIWNSEIVNFSNEKFLNDRTIKYLKEFGKVIDEGSRDTVIDAFQRFIEELDNELNIIRPIIYRNSKLSISLGVLSGLFIVIILF